MVNSSLAQSRMQQQRRKKEYDAMVQRGEEKHEAILQAAKDKVVDFRDAQVVYDTWRGAYDSDTFLQIPDIAEQRRVLVEIVGRPAAASDFTDAQVRDQYKSHIKKVRKAMLEMKIAAPVDEEEE